MFLKIVKLILAFFIFISLPFTFFILSPIFIFRYIISKTAKFFNPDLGKILTTKSTCVGVDDIYGNPQWTLLLGIVLKGRPRFESLKKKFEERVLDSKDELGELNKPELRQYVTNYLGFLFWKCDKDFNIDNHVHQNTGHVKYEELNEESLFRVGRALIYKPYADHKSPWELIFLDNYQHLPEDNDEPGSAILLRAHHVLADGFSLLKLFVKDLCQSEKLDIAEAKYIPGGRKPGSKKMSRNRKYLESLRMLFRGPYDLASAMVDTARFNSNEWHVPERQLKRVLNCALTSNISIQTVKEVKNLYNTSFAGVLLTAYAGALKKFMSEAGFKVPETILCAIALPMPNHPESKLRNHATGVLIRLPTGKPNAVERLTALEGHQLELKNCTLPITIFLAMTCIGGLFQWMTKLMTKNSVTTAVGSIFPGPNTAMSSSSYTALGVSYAGGLTRGNTGLGFSCLSYNGKMYIIVGIDEGLVPESTLPASRLIDYMTEELQELKREAKAKAFHSQTV